LKPALKIAALVLLLYTAMQVGCWRRVIEADSPDGQHQARIRKWCIAPDCGIRAELASGIWPITVDQVSDGVLRFGHIAWSPDSSVVAILAVNGAGRSIAAAWDVRRRHAVPFALARGWLSASITRTYGLSPRHLHPYGDAVEWAMEEERAHALFLERIKRKVTP
jgi:hypothetical protein